MTSKLIEGQTYTNGRTEMLYNGIVVAIRQTNGVLAEPCKRCWGSGHYSFNLLDGTVCYGCMGRGIGDTTTEDDVVRKAIARAKAATKRTEKAAKAQAEAKAVMDTWKANHAGLLAALAPYLPTGEYGEDRHWNSFLVSMAEQAHGFKPLSDRQVEAATSALVQQAERDAAKAHKAAEQVAAGHYSQPSAKIVVEVKITSVKYIASERWDRSSSYLVKMITAEGHVLSTFSSGDFGREAEEGQTVKIKATVKAHAEYDGKPETRLTRVAKLA